MERLTPSLFWFFLWALGVLGGLQVVPPLIRIYLMRVRSKRLKLLLFTIAFIALTFKVFARRKVRTDEGIELTGSLRTNPLVKCIYLVGSYEPTLVDYLKQRLGPDDVFVDIGANTGNFSLIAAKQGAEVISIEASPANCRLFRQNVEANALDTRIKLINAAAGDRDGKIELLENRFNGMWSTTVPQVFWYLRPLTRKILVPAIKTDNQLDDTTRQRIRLVKIDVEGAEMNVVRGLRQLIQSGREDLEFCLEFSPSWLTARQSEELFATFRSHGYRAYKLVNPEVDFPPYDIRRPAPCPEPPDRQVDIIFSRSLL